MQSCGPVDWLCPPDGPQRQLTCAETALVPVSNRTASGGEPHVRTSSTVGGGATRYVGRDRKRQSSVEDIDYYCVRCFCGLSSLFIGGHSPLLQRSQNFLLSIDALELVTLPSGP